MTSREFMIKNLVEKKKAEAEKRKKEEYEKQSRLFQEASLKITKRQENPKSIPNSYLIKDPNICPDIFRGEEYIKTLNAQTIMVLRDYTGSGSRTINDDLRTRASKSQILDQIKLLDKAFDNAPPLESAITVYRGVGEFVKIRDELGYSSCSLKKEVSIKFGRGSCYTIILPAGCKVLFICPISACPSECEVLVNRSGFFRALDKQGETLIYENEL